MYKRSLPWLVAIGLLLLTTLPLFTIFNAQAAIEYGGKLNTLAGKAGYDTGTTSQLESSIGNVIGYILGFLGVIALIIVIWAGFNWMTAGGNDEKVGKAKKWMINGLIGLGIVILAYSITTFVIGKIQSSASSTTTPTTTQ